VSKTCRVVIGMDPHKRSATIEAMAADEQVLGGGRFGTDPALALGACSSGSGSHSAPAATTQAATSASYSDVQACQAFKQATTTGVPASASGENTLTWLQSQTGNADPHLQSLVGQFIAAWGDPSNTSAIDQAQAAVTKWCGAHQ
jgi:hypothetical protein